MDCLLSFCFVGTVRNACTLSGPICDTLVLYSRMCSFGRWLCREKVFASLPTCFRQSIAW
ncbi:unnamed protein product, partial [Brugia timori]|uniref:Secreted protein n=1 Tax=Brugia timori TaxID=42155 RepID=A0A0R3QBA8_9BILA